MFLAATTCRRFYPAVSHRGPNLSKISLVFGSSPRGWHVPNEA